MLTIRKYNPADVEKGNERLEKMMTSLRVQE